MTGQRKESRQTKKVSRQVKGERWVFGREEESVNFLKGCQVCVKPFVNKKEALFSSSSVLRVQSASNFFVDKKGVQVLLAGFTSRKKQSILTSSFENIFHLSHCLSLLKK